MARRKVRFSLQFKIMALIFSLIVVTMAVISYWSISNNLAMMNREIKKSATQVIESLSALRLVTSWKSTKADWTIYQNYMSTLGKLDANIILMAILDEKGGIKAYFINVYI